MYLSLLFILAYKTCLFKSKKTVSVRKWLVTKFCIARSVKRILARTIFLVSATFIKFLFFPRIIALQKLWKMVFISSKELFSFSRYSFFCISVLSFFSTCWPLLRGWSKVNFKVHDVINCLSKSSRTHSVWYLEKEERYDIETLSIDGVSDKEQFYRKIM